MFSTTELGQRVIGAIFTGLNKRADSEEANSWHHECRQEMERLREGDWLVVWPIFARWLLVDSVHGVVRFAKTPAERELIDGVVRLYARWISRGVPDQEEWKRYYDASRQFIKDATMGNPPWSSSAAESAAYAANTAARVMADPESASMFAASTVERAEATTSGAAHRVAMDEAVASGQSLGEAGRRADRVAIPVAGNMYRAQAHELLVLLKSCRAQT